MSTIQASTRGDHRHALRQAIDNRESFKTWGALKGYAYPTNVGTGRLDEVERVRLGAAKRAGLRYIVMSYDTPIYWETVDGTRYRVQQKFSVTTSKHMGHCPLPTTEGA